MQIFFFVIVASSFLFTFINIVCICMFFGNISIESIQSLIFSLLLGCNITNTPINNYESMKFDYVGAEGRIC